VVESSGLLNRRRVKNSTGGSNPPLSASLLLALCAVASAQLPPSETLPPADQPLFRAEISRLEKLLSAAPDPATVTYQLARTYASASQWPEAITWLRKAASMNAGLDPSRDSLFAPLHDSREFKEIQAAVRAATPTVSSSRPAFRVDEGDLVPESVAYDPRTRRFYFGSMKQGKIIRCYATGKCEQFTTGLGTVLGLKLHAGGLWLLNNSTNDSELIHYNLASPTPLRRYKVTGPGHTFNDLAIAPSGDIYLTDTPAGAVWHLAPGAADLVRLPQRFPFANGIALSPDAQLLYVSTFPDGITVLDLHAQTATPLPRPADLCLANIDGLYFHKGALIAIQNGIMSPRVVRLTLTPNLRAIARFEVLERRNPLFDGITTGVIAGNEFFYMANIQDDKQSGFNPIIILKLHL
jgi:streptogramin lyase